MNTYEESRESFSSTTVRPLLCPSRVRQDERKRPCKKIVYVPLVYRLTRSRGVLNSFFLSPWVPFDICVCSCTCLGSEGHSTGLGFPRNFMQGKFFNSRTYIITRCISERRGCVEFLSFYGHENRLSTSNNQKGLPLSYWWVGLHV